MTTSAASTLARATPDTRDRYVDLLRVLSIGVVVLGHWLMVTVTATDGRVRTGNILAELTGAQLLTWVFQVMPLFFLVGGAAHGYVLRSPKPGGYPAFLAGRLRRLLAPTGVFLAVWATIAALTEVLGWQDGHGGGALVRIATRTIVQPLWFLGVYLGLVALAPAMYRAHRRWGWWVPLALVVGAGIVDVLRLGAGFGAIGVVNLALVWLAAHQLGFFYADGALTRRIGAALVVGGLGATVLLTLVLRWYPVSMVGLPGAPVSNMSPPTLALVTHGAWLTGLVVLVRGPVTRWLRRPRVWTGVVAANGVVMTTFLWHLTALFVLSAGAVAAGWLPTPGGALWWATRPVWLAALVLLAAPLVLAARRFERPVAARAVAASSPAIRVRSSLDTAAAIVGAVLTTFGMLAVSTVGLNGLLAGRSVTMVVVPATAFGGLVALAIGWGLVRAAAR